MKFVCISDIHNRYKNVTLPEGDVLLISGDCTSMGTEQEVRNFNKWLGSKKDQYKHIIVIAGNHDWLFEKDNQLARSIMTNCTYLEDEGIQLELENGEKLNIWGSPWQPTFFNWAFNLDPGPDIAEKWDLIPDDTHILITHGPAFGYLDRTPSGMRVGCKDLEIRMQNLKDLKVHVFGHIHYAYGYTQASHGLLRINASTCTEGYKAENAPVVFIIDDINQDARIV